MKVSIITVTQLCRKETLLLTAQHVDSQDYDGIIEWVIVEGSKTLKECLENETNVKNLSCKVPIVYVPGDGTKHLGELRNISNKTAKGDIMVVMDDDDWYPSTRVSHAVKKLKKSKELIAGCSNKMLYDYDLDYFIKFKQFGPNHSTNDCFAYKREYLKNNSYDPTKDMAEESSFTKNFSNPMVQLDQQHTIVGSSHSRNTFSKKELCIKSFLLANPSDPSQGNLYPPGYKSEVDIRDVMGSEMFERYSNIFVTGERDEFDISYFCGGTSIEWDPVCQSLGGSEQAVVNLSAAWVRSGKKVAVYGLVPECEYKGVQYRSWKNFPFHKKHSTVVLWRPSGINCGLPFNIKTDKLWVDFHDNILIFRHAYTPYIHKVDTFFFKSQFHLEEYEKNFGATPNHRIIPNGIRVDVFEENNSVVRDPYRFCYCSCYGRGLLDLLAHVWPLIRRNEPRAELHVYYGIESLNDQRLKQNLIYLMGQPGVMDHGRRPADEIAREKQRSTFHLYITDCPGEIDCISIRESLVAGCIPLLSNTGVFKNRDGLHFDLEKGWPSIAGGIVKLLEKPQFLDMAREQFKSSKTICSWDQVSDEWTR